MIMSANNKTTVRDKQPSMPSSAGQRQAGVIIPCVMLWTTIWNHVAQTAHP